MMSTGALAQDVTGAGASFPAPLYSKWAADYNKSTGVKINYQSVGSGAGIRQIDAKTVDFGASDMPLKDEDLAKKNQIQFPTVIGGVVPVINVQGIQPGTSSGAKCRDPLQPCRDNVFYTNLPCYMCYTATVVTIKNTVLTFF